VLVLLMMMMAVTSATASATSWDPPGTKHTLTSQDFSFSVAAANAGWTCSQTAFEGDVGASQVVVTSVVFTGCVGLGSSVDRCSVTLSTTGLPWTVTPSTSNVQIHGVNIDLTYGPLPCQVPGGRVTVTGTLNAGTFSNAAHDFRFTGGTGLSAHSTIFGTQPGTVSGTLTDDQRSLIVTD
jgi:hypothetical protein